MKKASQEIFLIWAFTGVDSAAGKLSSRNGDPLEAVSSVKGRTNRGGALCTPDDIGAPRRTAIGPTVSIFGQSNGQYSGQVDLRIDGRGTPSPGSRLSFFAQKMVRQLLAK